MASENQLKRKNTITTCPPSKRPSKKGCAEVATSALIESLGLEIAASFASNDNLRPANVATSSSSENPMPEKATPIASSGIPTPVGVAPSVSNENATPVEVAPSASNENATRAEFAVSVSSQNKTPAKVTPAVPVKTHTPAHTCSENPHFFSGLDYVDALLSLADAPEATHSEIIRPCSRESAHANRPYYVCLDCRNLATRHIVNTTPKLMRSKFLPMCIDCGENAMKKAMAERSTTKGQWSGCVCAAKWLCYQCKIEEHESASARRDAEVEWRRDINPIWDGEPKPSYCNFNALRCICGGMIGRGPVVCRCVGCEAIAIRDAPRQQ